MKIKDLIKNKDYDCISWRLTLPETMGGGDTFIGSASSKKGKLISLDGDTIYDEEDEVLKYEEWSNQKENIVNGLTVVVKGEWV